MIGEDKLNGSSFQNVNCYASTNLVEWNFAGALLSRTESGELGPNRVVERPKVIYNESTKKYVLYMHVEDSAYKEAKVGVAVGDTVCGKYEYLGSFQPMDNQSRDMGLYQDDDGTAYLLSEDVCSFLTHEVGIEILMSIATPRSTYLQVDERLLESRVTNLHVARKVRVARNSQKRRRLFHVRLSSHRLAIKRQPLLNRDLTLRSLVPMGKLRPRWKQNLRFTNHVHPAHQQRLDHLYG